MTHHAFFCPLTFSISSIVNLEKNRHTDSMQKKMLSMLSVTHRKHFFKDWFIVFSAVLWRDTVQHMKGYAHYSLTRSINDRQTLALVYTMKSVATELAIGSPLSVSCAVTRTR